MNWKEYITADQNVLVGKPVICGTRISIELILDLLSSGWTKEQLLESYPQLSEQALQAVFAYLKDCMQNGLFFPISKSA